MPTEHLKYEDAAEMETVTGWSCKVCKRFYGAQEHLARRCCATELPCDCGGRNTDKCYTKCGACRTRNEATKWEALYAKAVKWDGSEWPIYSESQDRYFWNAEELHDWFEEQCATPDVDPRLIDLIMKPKDLLIAEAQFRLCSPNMGHPFEMNEFLCDVLAEDQEVDSHEIDKVVNDWIVANAPYSWTGDGKAIRIESIQAFLEGEVQSGSEATDSV